MTMAEANSQSQSILVLAPTGRDARLICRPFADAQHTCEPCADIQALAERIREGAGVAVLVEETLSPEGILLLREWIDTQPPWSDFPFIVLTTGGESTQHSLASFQRLRGLGNVTLLERPLRTVTLVSAVEAALRARARQFQAQAYVEQRLQAEAELISKAQQLAVSNADLQQFAYVTSHDLQEPLRTIQSYSQLMAKRYGGRLDEDADQFLTFMVEGANRMRHLITDLLSYSRVVNLEPRCFAPVPMDSVLAWASANLQLAIADTGTLITHDELPVVAGDQVLLVQLLQNLISNAIKYRGPDTPRIHISARKDGAGWLLSVRDNGIGIAPMYLERIFGIFKRLHGREIPGTGIGLAICRKIVEQHQGRLWAESTVGQGTTFLFTLPAEE
ncbi:MAG TPA: ATP-binding protein [Bryobacteraceae bacterium]|nr:ATP-binding protein [Bryobacteraceae bacterium]